MKKAYITVAVILFLLSPEIQSGELAVVDGNGEFIGLLIVTTNIAHAYRVKNNRGYVFVVTADGGPDTADPQSAIYLSTDCSGQPYLHTHSYEVARHIYPVIDNPDSEISIYMVPDNPDFTDATFLPYSYYDMWSGICAIVYPPVVPHDQTMMVVKIFPNDSLVSGVKNKYAKPVHPDFLPYTLATRQ